MRKLFLVPLLTLLFSGCYVSHKMNIDVHGTVPSLTRTPKSYGKLCAYITYRAGDYFHGNNYQTEVCQRVSIQSGLFTLFDLNRTIWRFLSPDSYEPGLFIVSIDRIFIEVGSDRFLGSIGVNTLQGLGWKSDVSGSINVDFNLPY